MAKETGTTYTDIVKSVNAGQFASVYLLHGEEEYYIDQVSQYIAEHALKAEERDFNFDLLYGADTRANDIINIARQFPMMAERRVVVVREFQSCADKDTLVSYVRNPMPSTVLVLCHKHGTLDGRRQLASEVKKHGVVMESRRLYEDRLPDFVTSYMRRHGLEIEPQAVQMLCEHVGSDLTRLALEMDKLRLALPEGGKRIGAPLVEDQTGVSKDYNNFELQNALAFRDILKANKIVNYYNNNPKGFVMQLTLTSLFSFFSDVMLAYYAPEQTDNGIAQWIGKSPWAARQAVIPARRKYAARKVVDILAQIRETDAKSKGVGGCRTAPGELLQELIFFILH